MVYRKRALESTLAKAARTFPAVLVTGARQTGKTTILRQRFGRTHRYVSLERPDIRAQALADPLAFFEANPPPLILDEIQYAPDLLHYVKDQIDEARVPGRWLLTGSQSLSVMRGVSQSLAGRVATLTLDPFGTGELAGRVPADVDRRLSTIMGGRRPARSSGAPALEDRLLRGGFPELCLTKSVDRRLWLSSYVQTYLERDVRDLLRVGDLGAFGRFLSLVAARNGTLLSLADLARDVGVSAPTAGKWLSTLEATGLVYLLRPFHRNFGKRLIKAPKLYVMDPALTTYLTGLHSADAVLNGPSFGSLFESLVVIEWVKTFHAAGESPSLYFWRSSAGEEVDLLIEREGKLWGFEIKSTMTPTPHHAASLAKWLELAGPHAAGALICRVPAPVPIRPKIRAVPWSW